MNLYSEIARRVRVLREARGWSQEQLAALAELSEDDVSRLERGILSPRLDTLEEIAIALDVPLRTLIDIGGPLPGEPKVSARTVALQRLLDQLDPKLAKLLVALIRRVVNLTTAHDDPRS